MNKYWIWILLLAGFLARLVAFGTEFHFGNDIITFQAWAIRLFEDGKHNFFDGDFFSDYPPVYMYVLYMLGAFRAGVRAIFGYEYWHVLSSRTFMFFTFLPAILADLGIGFVIYRMAAKKGDFAFSLFVTAAWLFNPAIILISGAWGQVESVFVLPLLISLLFVREKKLLPAYILFGLAILTKPQSLFLGPVYLYSAIDFLRSDKFSNKSPLRLAAAIGAGMLTMVVLSLPFGLRATWNSFMGGLELYQWAALNASNFWAMIGENWGSLETVATISFRNTEIPLFGLTYGQLGFPIAFAIIAVALVALHFDYTRHGQKHFFLIVAAIFLVIFTFSVRMHERYLFAGIPFLLVYYLENRQRREFVLYWAFSAVFFLNCLEVLRWANEDFNFDLIWQSSIRAVSFGTVTLSVALIFMIVKCLRGKYLDEKPVFAEPAPPVSKKKKSAFALLESAPRMKSRDYWFIGILIAVYTVVAFTNLGDTETPQTAWVVEGENNSAHINFGDVVYISEFQFLMGARHDRGFGIHMSLDGQEWTRIHDVEGGSVFAWHFVPLNVSTRYIFIGGVEGLRLQEIGFRDANGNVLPVGITENAGALVDEQHLLPTSRNFMNSTYFDEIYHPRTGYEFLHGLTVFETTHPPLGKVFMSASIRAFGMTPFGWRFPGTLFGVLMIPVLYAFARKLFKSNNIALFASFIFTFDFMLFSHTRLATIDTFVTFFVLLMYFIMYCYTTDLERNSFKKSLILLAICGATMGLAIASKWQGVYGAIGLPILFFPSLYKLFLRDRRQARITFFSCFGFFVAIPIVIYTLSYIPFVYSMSEPGSGLVGAIRTIWDNQNLMLNYHSLYVLDATHPFGSDWWSWPVMLVPLWQYQTVISDTVRSGMTSIGNPAVWWFGIPATAFAIYSLTKKSRLEYETVFLLIAYAVNFLPWVFVTRLTFIYHYFPSVPFVVLIIALFFKRYVKRDYWYFGYAGVVFALFVLFFPVLSGRPVDIGWVDSMLRWLPRWHFV